MSHRSISRAVQFVSSQLRRRHPITLSVLLLVALTAVAVTVLSVRAADAPASTAGATSTSQLLPDGRTSLSQVRWDNYLMTAVPGFKKRSTQEWGGQWTLEGQDFDKSRVQVTMRYCANLDEKGLAALADATDKNAKTYIDWKEEAPRVEATHPQGYKTLTTFTSLLAEGYGKGVRLYSLHVYLEANGLGSHVEYSAATRANFDKHRPAFEQFLKDLRLLSAQTLAPAFDDQPPLEQFTVNQCCDFVEWLLDVPLTDAQREAARDYFTAAWQRKDKNEAKDLWDVFAARNDLDKLPKEKKELARTAARAEVIKQWRDEAAKGDRMAKLMIDVYDAAHQPIAQGKAGEPPLTRQQSDATLEILHFMASKVAGFDVGPSAEQKKEFAAKLAANYGALDAATKKEMGEMPLYWAWFRAAWPDVPADERAKLLELWGKDERVKPIVAQINDAKAKAIASGDPSALGDAMRKLYQQQQNVAMISNMMAMQHRTNMTIINNIGSSNTRYEYKYVYRYR